MNDLKSTDLGAGLIHMPPVERRKTDRRIAYFSMEIGVDPDIPTYAGGLGILAGDTIKSCADLHIPLIGVTLLYKKGYFFQKLDEKGNQQELPTKWNPADFLQLLPNRVSVAIGGRDVLIQAWRYNVMGTDGYCNPIFFLDTDIEGNGEQDRSITHHLYGGDEQYRLAQEAILGIGGVRVLKDLGYQRINRYHMNEGHSGLLTLELLNEMKKDTWDFDGVRRLCVFTTHTPVPAGHDQFSYEIVKEVVGDFVPRDILQEFGGKDRLNMTFLALNLSHYVNGVAKEHGKVSREMFPGYHIDSITNGVHSPTWVCESFKRLYDQFIPGWTSDPFSLRYALSIPGEDIWQAHLEAKKTLIDHVNRETDAGMDYQTLTIGFARRAAAYKRADLLFSDIDRLQEVSEKAGHIQLIFAGKSHPMDVEGKDLIKRIFFVIDQLKDRIKIVYLKNYDMSLAKMLLPGVDLWLNTPRKPQEASGTSGMKAAHNGVPSLSILDGWWIEGCIEGLTGWAIGSARDTDFSDTDHARFLYAKLEQVILPTFYYNHKKWIDIMRHCVAINASFFNTHRMVQQYVLNAYL
jgi:starch phosphorylase